MNSSRLLGSSSPQVIRKCPERASPEAGSLTLNTWKFSGNFSFSAFKFCGITLKDTMTLLPSRLSGTEKMYCVSFWSPSAVFPGITRFLNIIWDHLSWSLFLWSRLIGNRLHIYKQEKFSWKSWHDILLKIDTHHLMTTVIFPWVGGGFPSLYCTFACQLQYPLTYHYPTQGSSAIKGRVKFWVHMSTGKGFIINFHFLKPLIKLWAFPWPAGWGLY